VEGQAVTQVPHNVVPICPKTDDEGCTCVAERPDRNWGFGGELRCGPDEVHGCQGADGADIS
jgi:hypothetical protein